MTSLVTGDGTYSFDLVPKSADAAYFYSKEEVTNAAFQPQLVLTLNSAPIDTTIDTYPGNPTNQPTATFAFSANQSGATFECALDGAAFAQCTSPMSLSSLTDGSHVFAVRAKNGAGTIDPSRNICLEVDSTAPTVSAVAPSARATGIVTTATIQATFSEAMDPTTLTATTFTLAPQGGAAIAAAVAYDAAANKATLTPSANLAAGTTYTATIKGGAGGAKDAAGNPLAADKTWSFSTAVSGTGGSASARRRRAGGEQFTDHELRDKRHPQHQGQPRHRKLSALHRNRRSRHRHERHLAPLYASDGTADGPQVYPAGNSWTETGLNWNNRPARTGPVVDSKGKIATNTWVEFNVTALVSGNGTYTFDIAPLASSTSTDAAYFYAKEAADATLHPQLVLTVGVDSTAPTVSAVAPSAGPTASSPPPQSRRRSPKRWIRPP